MAIWGNPLDPSTPPMVEGASSPICPIRKRSPPNIHPDAPCRGSTTEIRSVKVPETGIAVVYQHHHESGRIDLLYVGR